MLLLLLVAALAVEPEEITRALVTYSDAWEQGEPADLEFHGEGSEEAGEAMSDVYDIEEQQFSGQDDQMHSDGEDDQMHSDVESIYDDENLAEPKEDEDDAALSESSSSIVDELCDPAIQRYTTITQRMQHDANLLFLYNSICWVDGDPPVELLLEVVFRRWATYASWPAFFEADQLHNHVGQHMPSSTLSSSSSS